MFRIVMIAAALAVTSSSASAQMYYGGMYGYGARPNGVVRSGSSTVVTPFTTQTNRMTGGTFVTPGGSVVQAGRAQSTGFTPFGMNNATASGVRVVTPNGNVMTRGSVNGFRTTPFGVSAGRWGTVGVRRW